MGQRQTGKTTLVEAMAAEYATLDDEEQLELALRSAREFIQGRKTPFAIDECQQSPALFPALKDHVRVHKKTGQFILTGSVRFTSVEEIKESLTGRMIDLELLPLSFTEVHGIPLTRLESFVRAQSLKSVLETRAKGRGCGRPEVEQFLAKGGLPGICFLRSAPLRTGKMRSHLKTVLDRDLRIVTRTTIDYLTLKSFLEEIALQQGEVFDLSRAARGARIALNSARKLLSGLESVYLIRTLRKDGDTRGKIVYFEDQGMATHLLKERGFNLSQPSANDLNRFLFQQLNAQIKYGERFQADFSSFRLKSGVIMDFVIVIDGKILAYSVGIGNGASSHQIRSAQSFLKKHPTAKIILLHLGDAIREFDPRIIEAPLGVVV